MIAMFCNYHIKDNKLTTINVETEANVQLEQNIVNIVEEKELVENEKEVEINEEKSITIEEEPVKQNNQDQLNRERNQPDEVYQATSRGNITRVQKEPIEKIETITEDFVKKTIQFSLPVEGGYISSHYGYRGKEFHTGTDIPRPCNTEIYASAAGTVSKAEWCGGYGRLIVIDHEDGYQTYYAHCNNYNVIAGQEVEQGDIIGYVGTSGRSTGYHLHFEIRQNGETLNPEKIIQF